MNASRVGNGQRTAVAKRPTIKPPSVRSLLSGIPNELTANIPRGAAVLINILLPLARFSFGSRAEARWRSRGRTRGGGVLGRLGARGKISFDHYSWMKKGRCSAEGWTRVKLPARAEKLGRCTGKSTGRLRGPLRGGSARLAATPYCSGLLRTCPFLLLVPLGRSRRCEIGAGESSAKNRPGRFEDRRFPRFHGY